MSAIPRTIHTTFHADLSDAYPGEDYWVRANNANHPLLPHTAQTRAQARAADPRLALVPDEQLTHYTQPAAMPTGVAMRVHIKHSTRLMPGVDAPAMPGLAAIFIPPSPQALVAASTANGQQLHINPVTTAKALAFHHPDLITRNPDIAAIVHGYMDNNLEIANQFEHLGSLIRDMGKPSPTPGAGWATLVPFTARANPDTGEPGVKSFFMNPSTVYMQAAAAALTSLMLVSKNDPALANKKWHVQVGDSVQNADGSSPAPSPTPSPISSHTPGSLPTRPAASQLSSPPRNSARLVTTTVDDNWSVAVTNNQRTHGLQITVGNINSATQQFSLTFNDMDLRYLGCYIRFFDAEGNTLDLSNWTPDGEDSVSSITYDLRKALGWAIEYDDIQFIGYTSGATTVLGIPTVASTLTVNITMPPGAVAAEVFGSGLGLAGTDTWPKTPLFGGALTTLIDLVIPAVMLAGAASQLSNATTKALVDKMLKGKWKFAVVQLIYYLGDCIYGYKTSRTISWSDLVSAAKVLFQPVSLELLLFIESEMVVEEAAEEVPFAGWVLFALNASVGIATLAETVVTMLTSPWNIPVGISATIQSTVTVFPDPRHQAFPQAQPGDTTSLQVTLTYKGQQRAALSSSQTVPASTPANLVALFPSNTLGGQIKIDVSYTIGTWQAAQASSGWLDNNDANAASVVLYLVQNPVPLNQYSVYQHSALLCYNNNQYHWQPTATAPSATSAARDSSSMGNAISQWAGLALSQRFGALGYAWMAAGMGISSCSSGATGQLYALQNVDIPGTAMTGAAFPSCGLDAATRLLYDPYPPKFLMQDGNWVLNPSTQTPMPDPNDVSLGDYYIDPRKASVSANEGGGYHLRQIVLGGASVSIDMAADQPSWGRFTYYPNSICMHPSGAVVAVNTANAKLSITTLQTQGVADNALPMAVDYAGTAQTTTRPGLLFTPVAVSCSYDGTILVLESTKGGSGKLCDIPAVARIQAFDVNGNSVNRFFDSNGNPTCFMPLQGTGEYTYLDLSVVGDQTLTYLYLLYFTGSGVNASDYHVAIYQYASTAPASNPLVTTSGVAAANLFVDMWHSLYTLNYAMVTNSAGQPAGPVNASTGPAGRTVPSLSEWLPPVPV